MKQPDQFRLFFFLRKFLCLLVCLECKYFFVAQQKGHSTAVFSIAIGCCTQERKKSFHFLASTINLKNSTHLSLMHSSLVHFRRFCEMLHVMQKYIYIKMWSTVINRLTITVYIYRKVLHYKNKMHNTLLADKVCIKSSCTVVGNMDY